MTVPADVFRLAHLSDIHLAPLPPLALRSWHLKRHLGAINWRRNRIHAHLPAALQRIVDDLKAQQPDHIAVSGDLVNLGLPEEHRLAAEWLRSLGSPENVSAVPGNHDIYVRMSDILGIGHWASHMASNAPGRLVLGDLADTFPYLRCVGPLALIGLNSALPRPPFYASGRLGSEQLARLRTVLSKLRSSTLLRVVMIHHPPLPGLAVRRKALDDASLLADILAEFGCELVLHGHNHQNMLTHHPQWTGAKIPIIGVPSASMGRPDKEPLARYNLMHFRCESSHYQIEMVGRGLKMPDGDVEELERRLVISADRRD